MPTNAINDTGVKYLYDKLHGEIEPVAEAVSDSEVTIEGNPLSFNTLSSQNAKSTILSLEPIQDLHGYPNPWVGGAGKNLLKMTVQGIKAAYIPISGTWSGNTFTSDNLKFTLITDPNDNITAIKYEITGTLSEQKYIYLDTFSGLSGNYLLSGGVSQNIYVTLMINNSWSGKYSRDSSSDTELTISSSSDTIVAAVSVGANISGSGYFYPMLRKSTVSDSTFEPYTNICPISGRTEIGILGCGKNLFNPDVNSIEELDLNDSGTIRYGHSFGSGTYTLINAGTNTESFYYRTPKKDLSDRGSTIQLENNSSVNVTVDNDHLLWVFTSNSNFVNADKIAVEIGSNQTFEAYNLNTDLTISLGQTVYGGTLDVENGVLVVEKASDDLSQRTWEYKTEYETWISTTGITNGKSSTALLISDAPYNVIGIPGTDLGSRINGVWNIWVRNGSTTIEPSGIAVYELDTPTTIQLTPHQVSLLKGANYITTDGDIITLTYRDGSVATLGDLTSAVDELDSKIDESKILTDTATGDKYILVVTNGALSVEQISN